MLAEKKKGNKIQCFFIWKKKVFLLEKKKFLAYCVKEIFLSFSIRFLLEKKEKKEKEKGYWKKKKVFLVEEINFVFFGKQMFIQNGLFLSQEKPKRFY